jgi:lipopolysaccharide transport system permease protein
VALLLAGQLAAGVPPRAPSLLLPVLLLPPSLLALGLTWFLCSVGVFVRDVRQVIPILTTALLFLSPVFYPQSAVPERFRALLVLNPLAPAVESVRGALFFGRWPDWPSFAVSLAISALACWLGFAWFASTRKGFADVL